MGPHGATTGWFSHRVASAPLGRPSTLGEIDFPIYKIPQSLKSNSNASPWFKNIQTLHAAIFEYFEQLSQLGHLQIPNRIHVKKFGTDSNLNVL
jgi:hypothetical protein